MLVDFSLPGNVRKIFAAFREEGKNTLSHDDDAISAYLFEGKDIHCFDKLCMNFTYAGAPISLRVMFQKFINFFLVEEKSLTQNSVKFFFPSPKMPRECFFKGKTSEELEEEAAGGYRLFAINVGSIIHCRKLLPPAFAVNKKVEEDVRVKVLFKSLSSEAVSM